MEFLESIKLMRKQFESFMSGRKDIDKLMKDKVDDLILIEELPFPVRIHKKIIYIGNFTLTNEHKFFQGWAEILGLLTAKIVNMKLSDDRRKELLEKIDFEMLKSEKTMLEFIWKDTFFQKQLLKLIGKTLLKQQAYFLPESGKERKLIKWRNCSIRYFAKWITKEKLLQICKGIHLYNFDAVKKNSKVMAENLKIKPELETYMYGWLQNCPGMNGKFLAALAPNIDSVFKDKMKRPSVPTGKNNG